MDKLKDHAYIPERYADCTAKDCTKERYTGAIVRALDTAKDRPEKLRELPLRLDQLEDVIAMAEGRFRRLAERLEPVVAPKPPEETDAEPWVGMGSLSPLGTRIGNAINLLRSLRDAIESLEERVQL